jgi:enhancer of mRNA-decapping protein 4
MNQQASAPAVLDMVMKRMNDMTSLIQTQRAEIQVLREEIRAMRGSDRSDIEQIVVTNQKRFADAMKKHDSEAARGTAADVCGAVRSELKKLAPSIAQQTSNSLHKSLEQDVHSRSAKASATVQEAIVKASQSKAVTDSLAQAALPHVQEAFREAFASVIVPGFERGLQAMLNQVSAVFVKGAKEHETVLAQMRKSLTDQVSKEMQLSLSKLKQSDDDPAAREWMVEQVVARVQEVILPELNRSLARNLAATPMTAVPPSPDTPSLSIQRMVKEHVRQGNYDAAFQVALSASNLPLVVATCEMVNPVQVVDQSECPLSQNVLLALVQQLGEHDRLCNLLFHHF